VCDYKTLSTGKKSQRRFSVDNDVFSCSLLPYVRRRIPSSHCQSWGQGRKSAPSSSRGVGPNRVRYTQIGQAVALQRGGGTRSRAPSLYMTCCAPIRHKFAWWCSGFGKGVEQNCRIRNAVARFSSCMLLSRAPCGFRGPCVLSLSNKPTSFPGRVS